MSFDPKYTSNNSKKYPEGRKFELLFVGKLRKYKGVEYLIKAIENLDVIDQCVIGIIIAILYYSLTEIYFSRSLAKYFTKTVVTMKDGSKPDNKTIFMRTFCRLIPIDFLTFLKIPARGWHDTISGTYVVKKHPFVEKKGWF